jgi:hypothetical protein
MEAERWACLDVLSSMVWAAHDQHEGATGMSSAKRPLIVFGDQEPATTKQHASSSTGAVNGNGESDTLHVRFSRKKFPASMARPHEAGCVAVL